MLSAIVSNATLGTSKVVQLLGSNMSNIQDKIVIITGASSGLGEATARRLASAGAKLMLAARREDRLQDLVNAIEKEGGTAAYRVTDVTKRDQRKDLAEATLKAYDRIDVLINNAGLMPLSPLDQTKVDEWDQMVDVVFRRRSHGLSCWGSILRYEVCSSSDFRGITSGIKWRNSRN